MIHTYILDKCQTNTYMPKYMKINMCETWAYKKGTSKTSHTRGIVTMVEDMRQQPGNSEHKTIYLPKAAHFRKHRANSYSTEVDGHNLIDFRRSKRSPTVSISCYSHIKFVCLADYISTAILFQLLFFFLLKRIWVSSKIVFRLWHLKGITFLAMPIKYFIQKSHKKSSFTHWNIKTSELILKIMYSLTES